MTHLIPRNRNLMLFFAAFAGVLLLGGCTAVYETNRGGTGYLEGYNAADLRYRGQRVDTESWWRGDGVSGSPSIVISLGQQKAFFYKGGKLVGMSILSTGDENHSTPTGHFQIQQKDRWHQSSQYGDYVDGNGNPVEQNVDRSKDPMPPGTHFDGANMYFFMRFTGGVGMHAGYLPGYPASHGCVRMPQKMAEIFFHNVGVGTPVTVLY